MARITVVMPVYNRQRELRRALTSLCAQTYSEFECLVVDDSSTTPIQPIIEEFKDPRLRYLRNSKNGGPYNARTLGYRHMNAEYLVHVDSDWEVYPWALAQAVHHLDMNPDVDAVSGMHVRQSDLSMFVRVSGGRRLIRPEDYLNGNSVPDCVGAVRKCVVDEWLAKRDDYFAMEFHQWFTFGLHHSQLYVDEPWTRYHVDGSDRVSVGQSDRLLDDYMKFIEEHDRYLRTIDAPFLNDLLFAIWFDMLRAGRTADRKRINEYLELKQVPVGRKLAAKLAGRLIRTVAPKGRNKVGAFSI